MLTIAANDGTNSAGFGWEFFGSGLNTGGKWSWERSKTDYMISLYEKNDDPNDLGFGEVSAKEWNVTPNPNGFPLEPWFSFLGINKGQGTFYFYLEVGSFNWSLRKVVR